MSDDDSSQEGVESGMLGGIPDESTETFKSEKAVQMLQAQAIATRKRIKLSSKSSSRSSGGGRLSSASRTRPVVKLLVTSVSRSYSEPWRRRQQRESSGTGFLIRWGDNNKKDDNDANDGEGVKPVNTIRIVTNAHVVRNASTVRARASFGPYVVSCEVEWMSLPLDLALLKIAEGDWDDFCKGWNIKGSDKSSVKVSDGDKTEGEKKSADPPSDMAEGSSDAKKEKNGSTSSEVVNYQSSNSICLTLEEILPKLDENVTCVGYPTGGNQISVTRGVVSRIDVDGHSVFRIQIDAAINPGNR